MNKSRLRQTLELFNARNSNWTSVPNCGECLDSKDVIRAAKTKEIFLTSYSIFSPSGLNPQPGSTLGENLSSDLPQDCCLAVESLLEHSRHLLQARKILQPIIEVATTPDFAREHSATNLKSRIDSPFSIEAMGAWTSALFSCSAALKSSLTKDTSSRRITSITTPGRHNIMKSAVLPRDVKTPNKSTEGVSKAIPDAKTSADTSGAW